MKNIIKYVGIILFLTGCSGNKPILPSKIYTDLNMVVESPNTEGWFVSKYRSGMIFSKKEGAEGNSYIALVSHYPLRGTLTDDDFLKMVKSKTKYMNKRRYKVIQSNLKSTTSKEYICIQNNQLVKDTEAHISRTDTRILLLKIKTLYCRYYKKDKVFIVSYSYRGKKIPNTFNIEAEDFLNKNNILRLNR